MRVSTKRLAYKLKQYQVPVEYVEGWDSSRIDPYDGSSDFWGVLLHHTAGTNSLNWVVNTNPYAPVRACHFLVDKDGTVHVVSGVGAYHAGKGGPLKFPKGPRIPKDQGNKFLYGIEIESLGTSAKIDGSDQGMSVEQVVSTAMLSAALLNAMRRSWRSYGVFRVIRHKDWTARKPDVKQDLTWWREAILIAKKNKGNVSETRKEITLFVKNYSKGKL